MKLARITGIAFSAMLAVSAFAADATGKYTGKMTMDMSQARAKMAKQTAKMTPQQKQMAESQIAMAEGMVKAMVFGMELKKGGICTMTSPGGPQGGTPKTETGKWVQKGNTIMISGLSKNDKGPKELTGTMTGNTIIFDISKVAKDAAAKSGKGALTGDIPTMKLTFTKK